MDKNDSLYLSLHNLYLKAHGKIISARDTGVLIKIPHEKIKARVLNFKMGHTSFNYDWNGIEYFDEYEWSTNDFTDFMDNKLKPLPEYEIAGNEICTAFEIPEDRKELAKRIGLSGFLHLLMKQVPGGRITHKNIGDYIRTFIHDYEIYKSDNLFTWEIHAWLGSIDFDGEKIELDDVLIRKPVLEELSTVRQKSYYIDDFQKFTSRSIFSTTVLQFTMRAEKQPLGIYSDKIRHEIEVCCDVLRLFKVANIFATHKSVQPISILEGGHTEAPESPFDKSWKDKIGHEHTSDYKCWIKKDEEQQLVTFFKKLRPILRSISPKNYISGNYRDLALHRYKDALLRSEVNVNRLVSAMSCVEALLSNSPSEITYKISIRVAALLGYFDFDTVKVFEKMQTAYKIRSILLHGSGLNEDLIDFSKNHTHEIINYARLCLLISLQLKDKFSKDKLIKRIDYSLIEPKERESLREIIGDTVFIPVTYPFRNIEGGDEFRNKKIACIGWGSLIWDPRELKMQGGWHDDGPQLPVEFVRESSDKRITLVIDKESKPVKASWALMMPDNVDSAVKSLSEREGSDKIEFVKATDKPEGAVKKAIIEWLHIKNLDAAIWTGLGSKFKGEKKRPTAEEVIGHLKSLQGEEKKRAEEYIRRAPKQIVTAYRTRIEAELGWTPI